jgi:hypothetical protein
VVAEHQRYLARQFAALMQVQQIDQAVRVLGNQNRHGGGSKRILQPPAHAETFGHSGELPPEARFVQRESVQVPLHAHEKQTVLLILMLIRMQNVGVTGIEEFRDPRHQPFAVVAVDQQDSRLSVCTCHGLREFGVASLENSSPVMNWPLAQISR